MALTSTDLLQEKKRALLPTKRYFPPRDVEKHLGPPLSVLQRLIESALKSEYLVIDLETRGNDYSLTNCSVEACAELGILPEQSSEIVGIGFAWDTGTLYLDWLVEQYRPEIAEPIIDLIKSHPRLVAHNVYFDGGYLYNLLGYHPNWAFCTYALLSSLANEGYPGEGWGLKGAMTEFLGWEDTNERGIDVWLCRHGYYRGNRRLEVDPDVLEQEYLSGKLKPEKGEMWRVPPEVLGEYCILDSEATYLLLTKVLLPVYTQFPGLQDCYENDLGHHILRHIEQKLVGTLMATDVVQQRLLENREELKQIYSEFRSLPEISGPLAAIEAGLLESRGEEPPRLKKCSVKDPGEPKYTLSGTLSKAWEKSHARFIEHDCEVTCISKNWEKWKATEQQIQQGELPEYRFNINSGDQLRILLYDKLQVPVRIYTESGLPATSNKVFRMVPGRAGELLIQNNDVLKETGFFEKYIELLAHRDTLHPSFRIPGTTTGRASSNNPNLMQVPKTKKMMELFLSRPGRSFVDLDFSALEPVVIAEFSRDPGMRFLYEDPSRVNDVYLFFGAQIPGEIGKRIRSTGFDPFHPSKDTISLAKKECKRERNICKTIALGCGFGAGPGKVMQTLEESGIDLDFEEVELIHRTYWDTFQGIKTFERTLKKEWMKHGYVLNGLGRPMCVPEMFSKDLLNRFVQSTGHDILQKYVRILCGELDAVGIDWLPSILDIHDAVTVEVIDSQVKQAVDVFNQSLVKLNIELGGELPMRGVPMVGKTLAEVKEPDI